ncbi:MAG TPA: hypothetical protein VGX71_26705 [Pseudaminobacter sp.]|nr:hypothetical protein [Pseudaminobacter sp.]
MPDELRMIVFECSGKADFFDPSKNNKGMPQVKATELNGKAEEIAEKIEREVRKLLPPYVSVQASVQFDSGSLILAGTISLLSWGGSIVFEAAKEEVERQLSELIKAAVQRVINKVFSAEGLYGAVGWSFKPMEMVVRPRGSSSGSLFARGPSPAPSSPVTRVHYALISVIAFLFLLVLLLVLNLFFEFRPRGEQPSGGAPAAQSSPQSPAGGQ